MDGNEHLWQQQAGEPIGWFSKFEVYRNLGAKRSLDAAYRLAAKTRKSPQDPSARATREWRDTAHEWNWESRAIAYDRWLSEQERIANQENRKILLQQKWELRGKLYEKALELLRSDRRWSGSDVLRMIEVSFELGCESLGMDKNDGVREQLNGCYEAMQRILDLPQDSPVTTAKDIVRIHLEGV